MARRVALGWSDFTDTGAAPVYSAAFKKKVVAEIESGMLNKEQAREKYHIGGKTTVLNWCRKYGKTAGEKVITGDSMGNEKQNLRELEQLRAENIQLKKRVESAELRAFAYEKLIEVAERRFKIDIKKKLGEKL